jgi:hypothetical protein
LAAVLGGMIGGTLFLLQGNSASRGRPLWPFGVSIGVGLTFVAIGAPMWASADNAANAPR